MCREKNFRTLSKDENQQIKFKFKFNNQVKQLMRLFKLCYCGVHAHLTVLYIYILLWR